MGNILCDTSPPNLRGSSTDNVVTSVGDAENLGRGCHVKVPSIKLHDFVTNTIILYNIDPSP